MEQEICRAQLSGRHASQHQRLAIAEIDLQITLTGDHRRLEVIRDVHDETGRAIGMKPAGGIRNAKQALHYLVAVKETLGDAWLNSSRYRFGASSLLNDLLRQIEKEKTGAYQAPYYFTEAAESY